MDRVEPEARPNITIEAWNTLVERARELDKISRQKSEIIEVQKVNIANLKQEVKKLKARLDAIRQACS